MYCVWHNFLSILLFQSLATGLGLNRPSSGQYLQKLKNAGAYSINIAWNWRVILYAAAFLSFCKYWPDDGLLRPTLVANFWNNKIKVVSGAVHILFHFNIVSQLYISTSHFPICLFLQVFRWMDMKALIDYSRGYANASNKHMLWDIYRDFDCFTFRD